MEKFLPQSAPRAQRFTNFFTLRLRHPLRLIFLATQVLAWSVLGVAQQPLLTRDEAVKLALAQASNFQQAQLTEQLAAEDVKQARAAFKPLVTANPAVTYNSPTFARQPPGIPRPPSFLGANAITEYQGLVTLSGEWDTSGKLKAVLRRNQALLQAAQAGKETARRALAEATDEAYYGLALTTARRNTAEETLRLTEEFARFTKLLVDGGEVAPLDLLRAELQITTRRDELEQARANEKAAADVLRALVSYAFAQAIAVNELLTAMPEDGELARFTAAAVAQRPELAQLLAEQRAAEAEIAVAQAERRAQISYSVEGGFIADALRPHPIADTTGARATVSVSLPLFDSGANRSRETQAALRATAVASTRVMAERELARQFSTALAQANSAVVRMRLVAASIPNAERNVTVSMARYRAGEAQIIEVTDAQNQLVAQHGALLQAVYDYQIAKARLRQATGQ